MHTPLTIDDPNLQTAMQRLDEAQHILAAALALHAELPPLTKGVSDLTLDRLEDQRRLTRAREAVAQAEHLHRVALGMAATRYGHARAPDRLTLLRTQLAATEAAITATRAVETYDAETAATLGRMPPEVPMAQLLGLDLAAARLRREIEGPPPPVPPPPPRPGLRRMTATKRFYDPDGGLGILRYPGDMFDVREEFVREIVAQELAVKVEA
jgi:hypothetical protein